MKTFFTLSSILFISIIFTSCVKTVEISTPPVTQSVIGTWYVSAASVDDGHGWSDFNANVPGIFNFYTDGSADYSDNLGSMQGYWNSYLVSTDYYDAYGNYQTNSHKNFKVDVSANDGSYIQLYFDNVSFSGSDQFITTYFDGKHLERYVFSRY